MTPEIVTFDCAQTLIDVNWEAHKFAKTCAEHIGLKMPDHAYDRYLQMFYERQPEFRSVNRTRDVRLGDQWWVDLTHDWLVEFGESPHLVSQLTATSDRLGFSEGSVLFRMYPDVLPCLDRLEAAGIRVAILSNWDYSLHKTLDIFRIRERFEFVLASMEEGLSKPDPEFFHHCLRQMGAEPAQAFHVGDNPTDDIQGARAAGVRCVRIVRHRTAKPGEIDTLDDLEASFAWNP